MLALTLRVTQKHTLPLTKTNSITYVMNPSPNSKNKKVWAIQKDILHAKEAWEEKRKDVMTKKHEPKKWMISENDK